MIQDYVGTLPHNKPSGPLQLELKLRLEKGYSLNPGTCGRIRRTITGWRMSFVR